jgi:outer membrane receptor protein involved in Fe transport
VLANAEFEITDGLSLSAGLSFARVVGGPSSGAIYSDQNGAIRINRDNAYLTPATAAAMDAAKVTFLPISRSNTELGASTNVSRNNTWRGFVALKGDLVGSWHWDAFYDYGRTSGTLTTGNQRITARWAQAVDAVFAPAGIPGIVAGTIVCRSTLTAPTNGCVPANVMGAGKVSPGVRNWVNIDGYQTRKYVQHNIAANVRGTLFHGWAGDISVAAGGEYRVNTSQGNADAFSLANAFATVNASLLPKITQKVTEGYVEANLPLFKDSAIGKSLELDGAVRRTHYSLSGNATTWKVGGVYELSDEYMLRVTRSHDIRAPSALELNPNTRTQQLSFSDPKYNIQYPIQSTTGGNPNLQLERANTLTIGGVFKPAWLPRFRLSVDYYDIKVAGAIDLIGPTLAVGLCRAGTVPGICRIGTDPSTGAADRILQLFATYQNVNRLRAKGLEAVANYSLDLLGGQFNFAVNGNYVQTLSTTLPDGSVREFADVTGNATSATTLFGVPKWRADAVITFERPTWSVTTQLIYIPPAILSRDFIGPDDPAYSVYLPNSIDNNRVGDRLYVNLNARVKLFGENDKKVELFGGINNLFDKVPPSNLRLSGNPVYFDSVGRAFKVGVRAAW